MRLTLLLSPQGHEAVAKGELPYGFFFAVRCDRYKHADDHLPVKVTAICPDGTIEVELPRVMEATDVAVADLKKQRNEVLAEAEQKATQLQQRIDNLLALPMEVK